MQSILELSALHVGENLRVSDKFTEHTGVMSGLYTTSNRIEDRNFSDEVTHVSVFLATVTVEFTNGSFVALADANFEVLDN